jgi:hypothetical protein
MILQMEWLVKDLCPSSDGLQQYRGPISSGVAANDAPKNKLCNGVRALHRHPASQCPGKSPEHKALPQPFLSPGECEAPANSPCDGTEEEWQNQYREKPAFQQGAEWHEMYRSYHADARSICSRALAATVYP